ncbi:MAG TPA: pyridoxamine 5-phosphate oxidase [Sulfurimonas sp.]|nr:pyridoxamine 5-phosphate oxidase [Sulfurimonas sp.]
MSVEKIDPILRGEHKMQEKLETKEQANEFYSREMIDYLAPQMKDFIKEQSLVFISTSDQKGECDCSVRSGKKGFVLVLDEKTLAYAEYKGNGVMASMGNIQENPHIGLLFLDFFQEDKGGLHVNATARVLSSQLEDNDIKKEFLDKLNLHSKDLGQKEVAWVLMEVQEAYIHCSKNIPIFK